MLVLALTMLPALLVGDGVGAGSGLSLGSGLGDVSVETSGECTGQCFVSRHDADADKTKAHDLCALLLFDKADQDVSKLLKIRYSFPTTVHNKRQFCSEHALAYSFGYNATLEPLSPLLYYVYGQRKILI